MTTSSNGENQVCWSAPSNIALVKYWGKRDIQIPQNPSISFTLSHSKTKTLLSWKKKESIDDLFLFDFYFEGEKKESFNGKIQNFFERLVTYDESFEFLKEYSLKIESENSFPHSTGIASSASSMSALALCLLSMRQKIKGADLDEDRFFQMASNVARIGSGSAARSLYPGVVSWGECISSTNEFAAPVSDVESVFSDFCDAILIVSSEKKSVSSTVGHDLMNGHPFAEVRFKHAIENVQKLQEALREGDLNSFIEIVETEALELHGLMMNSSPSFILMRPNTLRIINLIREFREEENLPICFTLDAGPNVHLLYPKKITNRVKKFIESSILPFCENNKVIYDHLGQGPERL